MKDRRQVAAWLENWRLISLSPGQGSLINMKLKLTFVLLLFWKILTVMTTITMSCWPHTIGIILIVYHRYPETAKQVELYPLHDRLLVHRPNRSRMDSIYCGSFPLEFISIIIYVISDVKWWGVEDRDHVIRGDCFVTEFPFIPICLERSYVIIGTHSLAQSSEE